MSLFSIITPVYNPPRDAFESCIDSVRAQSAGDWEWCLCDDGSTQAWVAQRLAELQNEDVRIKVVRRPTNGGIVAASNDAISIATGEFLVLLDNDDMLHADAIALVAAAVAASPFTDYVYSDEDKIALDGTRYDEFRKPVWSPERLLAQNYTSHLSVLRRSVVNDVGRFRTGFDGSQDYDLVLRVIEQARHIQYVPHVLYHWRSLPTSTASNASAKPYAFVAAVKAVTEHLQRCHTPAEVTVAGPSLARIRRHPIRQPHVSVIVPIDGSTMRTDGREISLASNVLTSLTDITAYDNFEVVLVAPADLSNDVLHQLATQCDKPLRVVRENSVFAQGHYFNVGLIAARSQQAVLIDQHCEFIQSNWLETLLGYIEHEHVAAVAPVLLDGSSMIVSAGLAFSPEPQHIAAGHYVAELGPVGMFAIARECLGVSTHCALVDVDAVKSVGGFSTEFSTRLFDFDLAAKLHGAGLHAIVTPLVNVRTSADVRELVAERSTLAQRWGHLSGRDPFTRVETRALLPALM
jgi:glycosyltransferase involved in cell wall biosynthesis